MLFANIVDNFILDSKKAKQVSNAFSLILDDNGADLFKNTHFIKHKLLGSEDYAVNYIAAAYHDQDRNEYGDKKTPHYHLIIEFEGRMQLQTCFNWICKKFLCNPNQVSIEKCNDIGAQVRYLIHMDDVDKYHYKESIIDDNNFERTSFYLDHVKIRDEKHLIQIIYEHPSKADLLRILGKKQYKEWRFAILDLTR